MPTRVRSFCKINLGLAVGPPRPDGFHGLTTLYQTVALHDLVTVTARPAGRTSITLDVDHPGVPCTASGDCHRNTAYRIVHAALDRLDRAAEVHIALEKRLPVQGGLGAGSANAAAALLGLERELGVALPAPERLAMAEEIGSDVPLFLLGGTVLGLNRGEAVYPLPDLPTLPIVVATPKVGVSTAEAFRDLDRRTTVPKAERSEKHLTNLDLSNRLEKLSRVLTSAWTSTGVERVPTGTASPSQTPSGREAPPEKGDAAEKLQRRESGLAGNPGSPVNLLTGVINPLLALAHTGVDNDFEDVAFTQHPPLRDIKRALSGSLDGSSQALYAALSGSGSALFGIYADLRAAHEAQQRVQSLGTRAFVTETLNREEFWRRSFA